MIKAKILIIITGALLSINSAIADYNSVLTSDSRIRTYIYNKNDIYLLTLHHGFESYIEFEEDETINTISLGEQYAWDMKIIDNKLFIRSLEHNIHTNMTILTNKRNYQFDLIGKPLEYGREKDLIYVLKFEYLDNTTILND